MLKGVTLPNHMRSYIGQRRRFALFVVALTWVYQAPGPYAFSADLQQYFWASSHGLSCSEASGFLAGAAIGSSSYPSSRWPWWKFEVSDSVSYLIYDELFPYPEP